MDKKEFEDKTFIDHKGYLRWKDSGKSIHRTMAYNEVFMKDKKKYPLDFSQYQVHHKDGNKLNNRPDNLEIIEVREHEEKHNIQRKEYVTIELLLINSIFAISWFLYLGYVSKYRLTNQDVFFFGTTFILMFILNYWVSRKKKGVKYV